MTDLKKFLNEDQLLTVLEEQENQISTLSSEISTLKSEIQKKSETIISLNQQIGKLNNSDKILKEGEKLKKEAMDMKTQADRMMRSAESKDQRSKETWKGRLMRVDALILEIQRVLTADQKAASQARREAEDYREEQRKLAMNAQYLINKKAEEMITDRKATLEKAFRRKEKEVEEKYRNEYMKKEMFHRVCLGSGVLSVMVMVCMVML